MNPVERFIDRLRLRWERERTERRGRLRALFIAEGRSVEAAEAEVARQKDGRGVEDYARAIFALLLVALLLLVPVLLFRAIFDAGTTWIHRLQTDKVDGWEWLALAGVGLWILYEGAYWLRGWLGRGQWPNPHGRYYNEWMRLPKGAGDYYPWLAARMGTRKPWRTWVQRERRLDEEREKRKRE